MAELVARVGVAARHGVSGADAERGERFEFEEFVDRSAQRSGLLDGVSAELTPTEFKLLHALGLDAAGLSRATS